MSGMPRPLAFHHTFSNKRIRLFLLSLHALVSFSLCHVCLLSALLCFLLQVGMLPCPMPRPALLSAHVPACRTQSRLPCWLCPHSASGVMECCCPRWSCVLPVLSLFLPVNSALRCWPLPLSWSAFAFLSTLARLVPPTCLSSCFVSPCPSCCPVSASVPPLEPVMLQGSSPEESRRVCAGGVFSSQGILSFVQHSRMHMYTQRRSALTFLCSWWCGVLLLKMRASEAEAVV